MDYTFWLFFCFSHIVFTNLKVTGFFSWVSFPRERRKSRGAADVQKLSPKLVQNTPLRTRAVVTHAQLLGGKREIAQGRRL